jgi:2-amino-4-hydroxy-6-hydroxymethyldihydropteridine diphosphokinase
VHKTFIALGSNLDDPRQNILRAIEKLAAIGRVVKTSSLYTTKPWGLLDQPDFTNAVVEMEVDSSPQKLLEAVLDIEKSMGRERIVRWGPRLIDLDILTFDDLTISEPNLKVPHPHMLERAFVLIPLIEIAPEYEQHLKKLDEKDLLEVSLLQKAMI